MLFTLPSFFYRSVGNIERLQLIPLSAEWHGPACASEVLAKRGFGMSAGLPAGIDTQSLPTLLTSRRYPRPCSCGTADC